MPTDLCAGGLHSPGAAGLDECLGDPASADNPLGFVELLAADERCELLSAAEERLGAFGLGAEFVPVDLGGRLDDLEQLVAVMRTLWRRDPCLGLGYGFSSFIAAVNVWAAGSEAQRRDAACLLLAGGRIAAAYHELGHGNDLAHAEFAARAVPGGWSLSGRKEVVANIARAEAMVIFARTDAAPGSRSHSQFLVFDDDLPADRVRPLPRAGSSGMRGVSLGGLEFDDCRIPADRVVGRPGQGIETVLRSFQVTRATLPAMCVGVLDTALRSALSFAVRRRLYGDAITALPYVRSVLSRAFADLLAVDAFSTVALRALHSEPEAAALYAAAVKSLATRMLLDAMDDLRTVLGAGGYLREGPHAIFQKLSRDLAPAGFGHASRAVCQVSILAQLPRLARRSFSADDAAPGALFHPGAGVAPLDFAALMAGSPRSDKVMGTLVEIAGLGVGGLVERFATGFRDELRSVGEDSRALSPRDLTIGASAAAYELASRYTVVLAAAACLGVWWHGRDGLAHSLSSDIAIAATLDRLWGRLPAAPLLTDGERAAIEEAMFAEAIERFEARRLFDLTARTVPG